MHSVSFPLPCLDLHEFLYHRVVFFALFLFVFLFLSFERLFGRVHVDVRHSALRR